MTLERIENPLEAVVPAIVQSRWQMVPVIRVEDARVVNLSTFQEDEEVFQSGFFLGKKPRSKRGMLEKADLQITLTLPRPLDPHTLSAQVVQEGAGFSSRHMDIHIGETTPDYSCSPMAAPQLEHSSLDHTDRVSILVPVCRGLSTRLPVFDEINYRGEHVLHHTIRLPGSLMSRPECPSFTWYIRLRIVEALGTVEVVSIDSTVVDYKRWGAHWDTFKTACYDAKQKVAGWIPQSCSRSRREVADSAASSSSSYSTSSYAPVPFTVSSVDEMENVSNVEQQRVVAPPQGFAVFQVPFQPAANPYAGTSAHASLLVKEPSHVMQNQGQVFRMEE